jgi:hypothetical protein
MKNKQRIKWIPLMAAAWLCFASAGRAQDPQGSQGEEKPKAAARAYGPIGSEDQDLNPPPDALQPDERPLTGFQQPTVGTPMERHSYWVPGFSYYNFVQSNGAAQGGSNGWNSTSYLAGNISLLENWSRSQLAVNYSGGGDFSTDSVVGNGWFQQLSVTQTVNWQRLQLTLLDQFAYLPQSQFGFGAGTGLAQPGIGGSLGVGSTGLGGGLDPGQSIFTAVGSRYSNTVGAQANYLLSPRTSVTFGGLFGIQRFTEAGNFESNNYIGNVGYNYQITREDTIGIFYRFDSFHYLNLPQAIGDQSIQAAYSKKITGRLALELTGGPEITNFRIAQAGSTKTRYVSGTGSATMTYTMPRGGVSLGYHYGVTSGSGVFVGAKTSQLTATGTRRLTRVWSGDVHLGYAHNGQAQTSETLPDQSFNTVYAGASLARPLGRNASFSLGYTAYVETSNNVGGLSLTTHQISLGLSWHTRPLVLH